MSSFIEKTVSAFAEQSFDDFDVIFVNDMSTDNTSDVISNLITKYKIKAKLIENESNTGPSIARKKGIENSDAEYCAFCDSDDWYDKDYLLKMYSASENGRKDIVFCNYNLVYEDGRSVLKENIRDQSTVSSMKEMLTIGIDGFCGGLFRRRLFDDLDFPNIKNGEDMAMIPLLISRAKSFGFVKDGVYNYYQREGSLSTSQSESLVQSLRLSFEYICSHLDLESYRNEIEYLGIRNLLYGAILSLFKIKFDKKAFCEIIDDYEEKFPGWKSNPYLSRLPTYKRLFVWFVGVRWCLPLKILTDIHSHLTK